MKANEPGALGLESVNSNEPGVPLEPWVCVNPKARSLCSLSSMSLEPESVNRGKWCLDALGRFSYGEDVFGCPCSFSETGKQLCGCPVSFSRRAKCFVDTQGRFFGTNEMLLDAQSRFWDGEDDFWMPNVFFMSLEPESVKP